MQWIWTLLWLVSLIKLHKSGVIAVTSDEHIQITNTVDQYQWSYLIFDVKDCHVLWLIWNFDSMMLSGNLHLGSWHSFLLLIIGLLPLSGQVFLTDFNADFGCFGQGNVMHLTGAHSLPPPTYLHHGNCQLDWLISFHNSINSLFPLPPLNPRCPKAMTKPKCNIGTSHHFLNFAILI